jgi:hypothetical protein
LAVPTVAELHVQPLGPAMGKPAGKTTNRGDFTTEIHGDFLWDFLSNDNDNNNPICSMYGIFTYITG